MTINNMVKSGQDINSYLSDRISERSGDVAVSDEWKNKITDFATLQAKDISDWVKGGKSQSALKLLDAKSNAASKDFFGEFLQAHGGKQNTTTLRQALEGVSSAEKTAIKNSSGMFLTRTKFQKAYDDVYNAAFNDELSRNGIEFASADVGGFKLKQASEFNVLA